jgi:glutathione S-transferase
MTKLFYSSDGGAASFISAYAAGLNIDCEQVDIDTHKTSSGQNFYLINTKGNVPCLLFDDGTLLNENIAVLSWIADQVALVNPTKLAPLNGTQDRYVLQCILSFIASELHSTMAGLFAEHSDEVNTWMRNKVTAKLRYVEDNLLSSSTSGKDFLIWADTPSIADFYLYAILSWCSILSIDLGPFPKTHSFYSRMFNLQVIHEAHSRMNSNPSCVTGTIQEKIQPTLDKITSSLSSVHHDTLEPAVEKLGVKLQPTVDKMESGAENIRDYGNEKISEMQNKMSSTSSSMAPTTAPDGMMASTSDGLTTTQQFSQPYLMEDSLGDKIESKLSHIHHDQFEPAVEKLGVKLQPTVDKMESGAESIRDYGNEKISEMQTKMNTTSTTTSTGMIGTSSTTSSSITTGHMTTGPTTGEKIESELSHLHYDKFEPTVEKLGEKLQPTVDKMESGAEKTRDYGNEKLTEMGYKPTPEGGKSMDPSSSTGVDMLGMHTSALSSTNTQQPSSTTSLHQKLEGVSGNNETTVSENVNASLSRFHHEQFEPAVEKLSENLKPTVNKMESGVEKIRDTGNEQIANVKDKLNTTTSSGKVKPFVEDAENKKPINQI